MLHVKFQVHQTAGSGDFSKVFTIYGHGGHLGYVTWTIYITFPKLGQPKVSSYISFEELQSSMLYAKFQDHRTSGSGKKGFYHIWIWQPSWSCNLDHLH